MYLNCSADTVKIIQDYFLSNGIVFSNENSISINEQIEKRNNNTNLTRFQLVASRVALGLSQRQLGKVVKIPYSTIRDYELKNNPYYISSKNKNIKVFLEFFSSLYINYPSNLSVEI